MKKAIPILLSLLFLASCSGVFQGWSPNFRLKSIAGLHNSANNLLSVHNPEDPESCEFEYLYNANGLLDTSTRKNYCNGAFGSEHIYAQYYYQGGTLS